MAEPTKKPRALTATQKAVLAAGRAKRAENVEQARREREERLKARSGTYQAPPRGGNSSGSSSGAEGAGEAKRPRSERGGVLGGIAQAFRG